MKKIFVVALAVSLSCQVVYGASIAGTYFQKRAAAQSTWKNLLRDLGEGKNVSKYKGKDVVFDGLIVSNGGENPILVKLFDSDRRCLVYINKKEFEKEFSRVSESCMVDITGTIRSVNLKLYQIEISSSDTVITNCN